MLDPNVAEQKFREDLKSVLAVLNKLKPLCKTPEEMIDLVELAIASDAQLRLLMLVFSAK